MEIKVTVSVICSVHMVSFNSLPNDKILHKSKLKAFADDKINVTEGLKLVLRKIEKIIGKRGKACYQHFLLFQNFFKGFFLKVIKKRYD